MSKKVKYWLRLALELIGALTIAFVFLFCVSIFMEALVLNAVIQAMMLFGAHP